jgi:hypothetical protein
VRSTERDQAGIVRFGAMVADAASGSGVAQPGAVPFTFARTGTGAYQITVDPRLTVLTGIANGNDTGVVFANVSAPSGSRFNVVCRNDAGVLTNSGFHFNCTARDGRL